LGCEEYQDEDLNISQLEMMFRGCTLVWYMKLQSTTPAGQARTLIEIRQALLKEFKKPKYESFWDYDRIFKDLMCQLTFQIPDQ
jgi:hypothetical protein